jgi:hypothetical protein
MVSDSKINEDGEDKVSARPCKSLYTHVRCPRTRSANADGLTSIECQPAPVVRLAT